MTVRDTIQRLLLFHQLDDELPDVCVDYCEASVCPTDCRFKNATEEEKSAAIKCLGQIYWERDMAISQLNNLGTDIGEDPKYVKERICEDLQRQVSELQDVAASLQCMHEGIIDDICQILFEGEPTIIGRQTTIERIKELVNYNNWLEEINDD